jgi:hypothetical protein
VSADGFEYIPDRFESINNLRRTPKMLTRRAVLLHTMEAQRFVFRADDVLSSLGKTIPPFSAEVISQMRECHVLAKQLVSKMKALEQKMPYGG